MESKAYIKRRLILDTATKIVMENDYNALTLDAVAKQAGISKGGLLYHFPNKELLIKGLAEYVLEEYEKNFKKYGENDSTQTGKWTRALIKVTKFDLEHNAELNVGLIAASILDPEMSKNISDRYKTILKKLEDDGINPVTATIIRLALDGLYYSQTLNVAPLEKERVDEVIQKLLIMSKSEG
jgi:AcrR family transcriptional regulator